MNTPDLAPSTRLAWRGRLPALAVARRRWPSLISAAVLVLGAAALVLSAIFANGVPVRQVELNDGGIWVTSNVDGLFGRLNRPAGSLDAAFYPPGGAHNTYNLHVLQVGSAVAAWDRGAGRLFPVDVARGVTIGGEGQSVPSSYQARMGGGTLAVLDPATGRVWAARVDTKHSLNGLSGIDPESEPIATVAVGAPGAPDDPAGQVRAALAVGLDGSIHAASVTGQLLTVRPDGVGFGDVTRSELGRAVSRVQVTAVGTRMVVLDGSTGALTVPDGARTTVTGAPAGGNGEVVLQWPGQSAAMVLVATATNLLEVDLDSGAVAIAFDALAGAPAAPMRVGECVHAAWTTAEGGYARRCGAAPMTEGTLENPQVLRQPVFRTNRGIVVLNDLRNGAAWDLLELRRMDNWSAIKPPPLPDPDKDTDNDPNPAPLHDQPPKAVDDSLGARPGRTTLLYVLDNDSAPSGGILSISEISAPDVPSAGLSIAPDGQTVAITLTDTRGPVHFTYTIDDGRNTAQASVTVEVRGPGENEVPKLRPGLEPRKWTVAAGARLAIPVLADWRDFDGDPVALVSAKVRGMPDPGTVTTRTDGFLEYVAPAVGGRPSLTYEVSDGIGRPASAEVDVTVLPPTAVTPVAPQALPDVARGQVGQPVIITPLDNDIPGSDPTNPFAKLELAGDVASVDGAVVVTNLNTGTVVLTADRPGPYLLEYLAAFGNAEFARGQIRVDVVPVPDTPLPPVAMPDTVVLNGQLPAMVDVLANDFDPAGGLLAVLRAEPASVDAQLQVAIVDGQWLRINALDSVSTSGASALIHYTISNGITAPVTGDVNVTRLAQPPSTQPVPADDFAIVRSGDSVAVAVLDNDSNPAGAPMMLVSNVTGAPGPGQLPVASPGVADPGAAYVTGNMVRFVAPEVTTPIRSTVDYVVRNAGGDQAVGHLVVTVNPPPGAAFPNRPPNPSPAQARAIAGQTVTIAVPTSGVDIDGDLVTVTGIATAPTLGRIVTVRATAIVYEAYPTSAGTDSFSYAVQDRFGAVGRATVRIGITPPGPPQPPVAVDDVVTAAPGARVHVDVLANDLRTDGDAVTILPLVDRNPQLPAGSLLASAVGPLELTAPDLTGKPLVVVYAITNGIGQPSIATVTVRSQEGFNNPPIAHDAFADPAPGDTNVTVDLLDRCADPDGDVDDLEITRVFDPSATVDGGEVTLSVAAVPRTVAYEVRDAGGATAIGQIHVSSPGSGAPYVPAGTELEIDRNGTKSIDITDYVVSPSGRPVRLTTTDKIWASPPKGLIASNDGDVRLDLTAVGDYTGPGALVFEVTDGASLTDPQGRRAVLSIPVQVGPETPVLHCPTDPIRVIEGGPVVSIDVTAVCYVWVADTATLPELTYSAAWQNEAAGVDLGGAGSRTITVSADSGTPPGTRGAIVVGVEGTDAIADTIDVLVVPAAAPAVAPVQLDGVLAGDTASIDLSGYVRSPLREPVLSVVNATQRSGMAGVIQVNGTTVTITPDRASHGVMTFGVTVTDVADTSRTDRHGYGLITLNVLGVPDPPGAPTLGATTLSRSVELSWTVPANNGAPIDVYEVSWSGGTQQCAGSPCLITGLINGQSYVFRVRARNLVGWSQPSAPSPKAVPNTVPGAVTGLTTSDPQDGTLRLTWVAPPNEGTPVQRYEVTWSGGGHETATGTTLVARGLDNNTQHTFTVVAVNALGPGPGTQVSGQSAGAPPRPPAPDFSAVNSADKDTRAVTVSWPAVNPNGPGPTTYTLTRTGGAAVTVCANVTVTQCTDDGIANDGTIYTYTLVASNAAAATAPGHTSAASPGASMEATATPDAFVTYSIAPTGADGQATLTFDVPASHGASAIVNCTWGGSSCGQWSYPTGGQGNAVRTITGLPDGQNTSVSLQLCNGSSGGAGAGTPCNSAISRQVTTYGNMHSLTLNASVSGTNVNFSVSVNANGKAAQVRVQSRNRDQTFTTGLGGWSRNFTDNVGYNTTDTITVTVSDPGRPTLQQSTSRTTGPPPPPTPTLSVSAGASCGIAPNLCSGQTVPDDCWSGCHYIRVALANFSGSVTCTFRSDRGGGFGSRTFGNGTHQTDLWYVDDGQWVEATCGGVTARSNGWP